MSLSVYLKDDFKNDPSYPQPPLLRVVHPSKENTKMSFKLFVFAVFACLAAVHAAKLSNVDNTDLVPLEKESRILEIPTLGEVIFKGLKVSWFLISSAWSVVGYKLAAIALLSKVAIWIVRNCLSAILGAAVTLAFCKLSGKCNLNYEEYVEVPEELAFAAKHLEDGTNQYSSS